MRMWTSAFRPRPSPNWREPTVMRLGACWSPRLGTKRNRLRRPRQVEADRHFTRIAATPRREIRTRPREISRAAARVAGAPRAGGGVGGLPLPPGDGRPLRRLRAGWARGAPEGGGVRYPPREDLLEGRARVARIESRVGGGVVGQVGVVDERDRVRAVGGEALVIADELPGIGDRRVDRR